MSMWASHHKKRPIADTLRTPYASTNSSLSAHRKAPIAFILLSLSVLRLACVWLRLLLCVWLVYMRLLSHWICDRHSKLFYKVERPLDVHTHCNNNNNNNKQHHIMLSKIQGCVTGFLFCILRNIPHLIPLRGSVDISHSVHLIFCIHFFVVRINTFKRRANISIRMVYDRTGQI